MSIEINETRLDRAAIESILQEIRDTYLQYPHPWVVGYSGGKDSTAALQLVWTALASLPLKQLTKPIHVISTDTLVETPVIVDYIDDTLRRINAKSEVLGIPFKTHKLSPVLGDTFWVNLIGRGYPAPTSIFRWCTERLKINPSNRFILEKVTEYGEVILVLGIRRGESATRDQVIEMHSLRGHKLARHGQLPGAWVYMPIEQFTASDVWTYLLQSSSPWGSDNRQLASLYRTAQADECPLVIDRTTPSCGNSRFGCWTCTVVSRDRSMEGLVDAGEDWMAPLLDFRDWLASTQDPDIKPLQREYRSRNGRIKIGQNGQLRYRTYTLEFCREILRRLLETQRAVQEYEPEFELIDLPELHEIRRLWLLERHDWEDTVPLIYRNVTGEDVSWPRYDDFGLPGEVESSLLEQTALEHAIPSKLLKQLIDAEWQHYGMRRRAKIHSSIEKIFNEDWRTLAEVQTEIARLRDTGSQQD